MCNYNPSNFTAVPAKSDFVLPLPKAFPSKSPQTFSSHTENQFQTQSCLLVSKYHTKKLFWWHTVKNHTCIKINISSNLSSLPPHSRVHYHPCAQAPVSGSTSFNTSSSAMAGVQCILSDTSDVTCMHADYQSKLSSIEIILL